MTMKTYLLLVFTIAQVNMAAAAINKQAVSANYYWEPNVTFPPVTKPTGASSTTIIDPYYADVTVGTSKDFVAQPEKGWAVDHWRYSLGTSFGNMNGTACGNQIEGSSGRLSCSWASESSTKAHLAVRFCWLEYKCVYLVEGSPLPSMSADTISYTNSFEIGAAPMRTGYEFTGWRDGSGKIWQPEDQVKGESFKELDNVHTNGAVVTLTSQWTVKRYAIGTDATNCSVTVAPSADYTNDVAISWTPPTTAGHDYVFKSAEVFAGEERMATFGSSGGTFNMSKVNKGYFELVTVKVVYEDRIQSYSVRVSSSDSSKGTVAKDPDGSNYEYGSTVGLTATPKDGYAFENWSDGGEQVHDVTVLCATNFVATFTNRVFTLTFNPNGGKWNDDTYDVKSRQVEYNASIGELPTAIQPKKQMVGWHLDQAVDHPVLSLDKYTWTEDITLYAHWADAELFSVTGKAVPQEGGMVTGGGDGLEKATSVTLKAAANPGYSFLRWKDDDQAGAERTVTVSGNREYEAIFTGKVYAVSFDANGTGATLTESGRDYVYGEPYGSFPEASREGYFFDGWYTQQEDGEQRKETDAFTVQNPDDGEPKWLYAHWTARPSYSVAYDGEGATTGTMDVQKIFRDQETALTSNAFVRAGYTFEGWAVTNDLQKVKYFDGTNVLNIAEVNDTNELHAVWKANHYWVKFDKNGGTGSGEMPQLEFVYDVPQPLPNNVYEPQEHYEFLGWSKNKAATTAAYTNQETVVSLWTEDGQTNTLYAVWKYIPSKLSVALDCDGNLHFEESEFDDWLIDTETAAHKGDSCLKSAAGDISNGITAKTNGRGGILTFWWKGTYTAGDPWSGSEDTPARLTVEYLNEDGSSNMHVETSVENMGWTKVTISLPASPDQVITFRHGYPETCWLDDVTWTPSEPTEPERGEAVTISSATADGGVFKLGVPGESGVNYGVWTNADLTVPVEEWGFMTNRLGEGGPFEFELEIQPNEPQLFYRAFKVR